MRRFAWLGVGLGFLILGCATDKTPVLPVVITTLEVDLYPHHVTLGPGTDSLLVSCFAGQSVCEISLPDHVFRKRFSVRSGPGKLVMDQTASRIYCLHTRENALAVFTGPPTQLKQIVSTGSISLAGGAMRPGTNELWICDGISNVAILTRAMQLKKKISVGRYPQQLAFDRNGRKAFITLKGENAVVILDTNQHQEIGRIPVGIYPRDIILIGNTAGVSNFGSHDISLLDTSTYQERARIPVRKKPNCLAAHKNTLWVACEQSYRLVAIDVVQAKSIGTIKTGFYPGAIWANPDGSLVVTSPSQNKVAFIVPQMAVPARE